MNHMHQVTLISRQASTPNPRATVLVTHGLTEHSGRYGELTKALNDAGFDVYLYDQPGHGTSEPRDGRADVGALINLHRAVRRQVRSVARAEELVLFGHSMGGLETYASALIDPMGLVGVILSAPAIRVASLATPAYGLANGFAEIAPALPTMAMKPEYSVRTEEAQRALAEDPLVFHGRVPMLTSATLLTQGYRAWKNRKHWAPWLPLLVFQGTGDVLVDPDGSREIAEAAAEAGANVEYVEVPGAYHEVFNEPEASDLREIVTEWVGERVD